MRSTKLNLKQSICTDTPVGADLWQLGNDAARHLANTGIERNGGLTPVYEKETTFPTAGASTLIAKDGTVVQIDSSNNVRLNNSVIGNVGPYVVTPRGAIPGYSDAAWTASNTIIGIVKAGNAIRIDEYDPSTKTVIHSRSTIFAGMPAGQFNAVLLVKYIGMNYVDSLQFCLSNSNSQYYLFELGTTVVAGPNLFSNFAWQFSSGNVLLGQQGVGNFQLVNTSTGAQLATYLNIPWVVIDIFVGTAYSQAILTFPVFKNASNVITGIATLGYNQAGVFSSSLTYYGITVGAGVTITVGVHAEGPGYTESTFTRSDSGTNIYYYYAPLMNHQGTTAFYDSFQSQTHTLINGYGRLTDYENNTLGNTCSARVMMINGFPSLLSAAPLGPVAGGGSAVPSDCLGVPLTNVGEFDESFVPNVVDNGSTLLNVLYRYNGVLFYLSIGRAVGIDRGDCESATPPMVSGETVPFTLQATWVRSADWANSGSYSYKFVNTIGGLNPSIVDITSADVGGASLHGFTPGHTYTLKLKAKRTSGGCGSLTYWNNGTYNHGFDWSSLPLNTPTDVSVTFTVPIGTTDFVVRLFDGYGGLLGDTCYVDDITLTDLTLSANRIQKVSDNLYTVNCLSPANAIDIQLKSLMIGVNDYNGRIVFRSTGAILGQAVFAVALIQGIHANSIDFGSKIIMQTLSIGAAGNSMIPGIGLPSFIDRAVNDFGINIYLQTLVGGNTIYLTTCYGLTSLGIDIVSINSSLQNTIYIPDTRDPVGMGYIFVPDGRVAQTEIETIFIGVGVLGSTDIDFDYLCYEVGNDIIGLFQGFQLFGQTYIFDSQNIWLTSFQGAIFSGRGNVPIASATGMKLIAAAPTEIFFLSSFDNSLYSYNGGRALTKQVRMNSQDIISSGVFSIRDNTLLLNGTNSFIWIRDSIVSENTKKANQVGTLGLYDTINGITIANLTTSWIYSFFALSGSTVVPFTWKSGYLGITENKLGIFADFIYTLYSSDRTAAFVMFTFDGFDIDGEWHEEVPISINPGDWTPLGFYRNRIVPTHTLGLALSTGLSTSNHIVLVEVIAEFSPSVSATPSAARSQ